MRRGVVFNGPGYRIYPGRNLRTNQGIETIETIRQTLNP